LTAVLGRRIAIVNTILEAMAAGEAAREAKRMAAEQAGEPLAPPRAVTWPEPRPERPRAYLIAPPQLFSAKRLVQLGQIADAMARVAEEGSPVEGFQAAVLGEVLPFLEFHGVAFPPAAQSRPRDLFLCLASPLEVRELNSQLRSFRPRRARDPHGILELVSRAEATRVVEGLRALTATHLGVALVYG
jgi:hypothetical protein